MSLPPINTSAKFMLPVLTRDSNYNKFKTTSKVKILNPLIQFIDKNKTYGFESSPSKASLVMSPVLPESLQKSKFMVSRLSPVFPLRKSERKAKKSTYLKQRYLEAIEKDKLSKFTEDFIKPLREFFNDPTIGQKKLVDVKEIVDDFKKEGSVDLLPQEKGIKINNQNVKNDAHVKAKYSSMLVPPPNVSGMRENRREFVKIVSTKKKLAKSIENKYVSQSLQTEIQGFDFDEWEFDYNG